MAGKKKRVGFIGLGEMGVFMATNLVRKGFDVTVHDLRKEQVEKLQALGANGGDSSKGVARVSDLIITMVRDDSQTDEVLYGKNGVWEGVREGSVIVICSTIDPFHCQSIAAEGEKKGVKVLDAPVSGAWHGAQAGTLTIMVGGKREAFEECRPVFEAMGKNIFYLGSAGLGALCKVVNNLLFNANWAALSEAVTLGQKAGLKLETLLNVIRVSSGGSFVVQKFDLIVTFRDNASQLAISDKDLGLALKVAEEAKQPVPIARLCSQLDRSRFFPLVER